MIFIKKFLAAFFSPLSVSFELLFVGVVCLWFTKKQRTGRVLVSMALVLLVMCSSEGISGRILHTLESQYPPITLSQISDQPGQQDALPDIKWIVVLAGGVVGDQGMPYQLQISHYSRVRLLEGIRLHRLLPGSKIILTGGIGFDGSPEATTLSRVAEELGVAKENMILEVEARDTKDHPLYVRDLVQKDPFILVTSAFHMPRAMKLFAKQGLFPFPAPAGHWSPPAHFWSPKNIFPTSAGIRLAELSYHEYGGMAWAWLHGQI
ncbi:MAG: ElyC/SanA/YdcF family protein [Nitrospirales bacterium]